MWLKVERSSLQFMNPHLLRSKRNENWTFWGFLHSIPIWLVYVIVRWPHQGHTTQNLLWNIIYNFGFKFQPVDQIFLQVERTVLLRRVHQKLTFLTHLIAYAWIQNISKLSNLRRHKKDTNDRRKFTYVRVNLIFPPSLASGKPRIELKKVNRSINTGNRKFRLYGNLCFFPKITPQSKTGRTKDHIL